MYGKTKRNDICWRKTESDYQIIKKRKKVVVPDLCELFGVSPATIRNDLNELESQGLLKRTHGGAIINTKTSFEQNIAEKITKNSIQKEAIGKLAAKLVEDGDTIAIDTGTTNMAFVRQITNKRNLTVVTNDIKIACILEEESDATVILVGGVVRKNHHCTIGTMAVKCLEGLRVDKCFMATNGLTIEGGLTTPDMNQADVKKHMAYLGEQLILLCDSGKIGTNVFAKVLPVEKINILITDSGIDLAEIDRFEQLGVDVQVAEVI